MKYFYINFYFFFFVFLFFVFLFFDFFFKFFFDFFLPPGVLKPKSGCDNGVLGVVGVVSDGLAIFIEDNEGEIGEL